MPLTRTETNVLDGALSRIDNIAADALEGEVRQAIQDEVASMSRRIHELGAPGVPNEPENLAALRDLLAGACEEGGVRVTGTGYGYDGRPFEDFSVRLRNSSEAHVHLTEIGRGEEER